MVSREKDYVAGIDGAPGGWAVVVMTSSDVEIRRIISLSDFFADAAQFDIVAIDMPIGLLDAYEVGGRSCDRSARSLLRKRGSSVFPAPVRPVLKATGWKEACAISRASASHGKAISRQTFGIIPKIIEVDELLRTRSDLREIVREVHPEVSFCELGGAPMKNRKSSANGREERRRALKTVFPMLEALEKSGRSQGLPLEDILDATVACWSAQRLAVGKGRSLPEVVPIDTTGLAMAIWV